MQKLLMKTDPLETDDKPDLVMAFQDATATVDSAGLCMPKYYERRDRDAEGRLTDETRSRYGLPA
ncbi:MAG: Unknown protein [uncultured Thiotrichaceae bacterium]|uniref:Uncharacterized protein n=1 Tax=uncultured Thiotrichaceae bacterium TaxID=298394 RepID=A0A6S6SJA7_9GAMM|nr:MAG: Unknown protein [uncultured Thiotrichaceae bacterium]